MSRLIIFLGTYAEGTRLKKAETLQQPFAPTLSGNKYSILLRDALKEVSDGFIEISLFPGNSYPLNKQKNISDDFWDNERLSISFWNNRFLRNFSIKKNLKRAINSKLLKLKCIFEYDEIIIVNSDPRFPLVWASCYLKRRLSKSKLVSIFPDLPNLTNRLVRNPLYRFLKAKEADKTYALSNRHSNVFVFFSETMKDTFDTKTKNVIVFPPFIEKRQIGNVAKEYSGITVAFTGSTDEESSEIHLLIESMKILNPEKYRLLIVGAGGNEEYIKESCRLNNNIIYLGKVSYGDCVSIQNSCDILISLRRNSDTMNYACSSKIFEYLSAKKPIICFETESLPKDVNSLLFHPNDKTAIAVAECIKQVSSLIETNLFDILKRYEDVIEKYTPSNLASLIVEAAQ